MISSKQADKIEYIITKFKRVISHTDIFNWLKNFHEEEWSVALEVLSHIEYFGENEIISFYEENLMKIYEDIENYHIGIRSGINNREKAPTLEIKSRRKYYRRKLRHGFNKPIIHAIGVYGKSGTAMMYYATHTPSFKKLNFEVTKSISNINIKNKHFPLSIILLDDFIGTGKSVTKYINEVLLEETKKMGIVKIRIYILSVIIHQEAKEYINKNTSVKDIIYFGQERKKAFSPNGSVFGYRPRMIVIREFCYKYGLGLYKHYDHKRNIENEYPLGYMNCQSLVVFSHTVPNNTLPIIWSAKRSSKTKKKWHPLFPRNTSSRISNSKDLKKDSVMWISIAKNLQLGELFNQNTNNYSIDNIRLISYIKLKKTGLRRLSIGIKLNLSDSELNELIFIGYKKKVLEKDGELTEYGTKLYNEVMKSKKRNKRNEVFSPNEILYLPKKFRGKV